MENSLESISQCGQILGRLLLSEKTAENDLNDDLHHGLKYQH